MCGPDNCRNDLLSFVMGAVDWYQRTWHLDAISAARDANAGPQLPACRPVMARVV